MNIFIRFEEGKIDSINFVDENGKGFNLDIYYSAVEGKIDLYKDEVSGPEYYRSREPEYLEDVKLTENQKREAVTVMFLEWRR